MTKVLMAPPTFGAWLGMQRRMIELTQAELAERLGITRQTVSNWEQGVKEPALSIQQIKTICELFQCQVADIPNP